MGLPSLNKRIDAQVYALRAIEKMYGEFIEFIYPQVHVGRIFHDFARNAIVEDFLASGCDILWFLDSDIVPPDNIMEIVLRHDEWKVAGAPYPVFLKPPGFDNEQVVYTVYNSENDKYIPTEIPEQGSAFVDAVATGCIFIKKEVFAGLVKPYFEFKYNPETREMTEGEDLGFCKKINALGYKFYVDFSKICDHYKEVSLIKVNNYAILRAENSVLAFHRYAKEERTKRLLERSQSPLVLPK